MTATMNADTGRQRTRAALFLAVAMAATVGSALAFQYIGGYIPCHLCLEQRTPYYIGAPLMVAAAITSMLRAPAWVTRGLLAIGGLLMPYGLYLGVYHSGVEWQWWPGPTDCSGPTPNFSAGGSLLDQMNKTRVVRCDEAALRILGLSLAGWNAIASLILAAVAFRSAFSRD